jgi:hypothetical protein
VSRLNPSRKEKDCSMAMTTEDRRKLAIILMICLTALCVSLEAFSMATACALTGLWLMVDEK